MSLFKLFGLGSKKSKNNKKNSKQSEQEMKSANVNDAIQALNTHVTRLEKQKNHTSLRIAKLTKEAQIASRNKDKTTALHKLKLRKTLSNRVENMNGQIMNLEIQILTLDDVLSQSNMVDAMTIGRNAIKEIVNDKAIEDAEDLHDDLQAAMDMQSDLGNILNEPLTYGAVVDDSELETELRLLEEEDMINDPQSNVYLYPSVKNQNQQKQLGITGGLVDDIDDESKYQDNSDNNTNADTNVATLSKEEENMLKDFELQDNLLLNQGRNENSSIERDEDNYCSDSDMEMVIGESVSDSADENECVRVSEEIKDFKVKETEKKKINVMMVTSGQRQGERPSKFHNSKVVLCC